MAYRSVATSLEALGDPTRQLIVERLRKGPRPVGEIADGMAISRPAVSQHLKILKASGLVSETRAGTRHYFALAPEGIGALRAYLDELWGGALTAFKHHVEKPEPAMSETNVTALEVPALEKNIYLASTPARAFQAFTAEIAAWWPLATHSVHQEKATGVRIEPKIGGRIYETGPDGAELEWGRVLSWIPPHSFSMTWHPGRGAGSAQIVMLSFIAEGGGTRLRLIHQGWEKLGARAKEVHDNYDGGWDKVLGGAFADYIRR